MVNDRAPSRTGQAVATIRATFDRPTTSDGDPDAQRRLCVGMVPSSLTGWLAPHIAARTRFIDERVLAAVVGGTGQVVIVGAGYDDRALRFRAPGVRFFELDHPATQADKRDRLLRIDPGLVGITLVPVDLAVDDVGAALGAAGHRHDQPTVFVCEGLLAYLERSTIESLLTGLADLAGPSVLGSRLLATLAVTRGGVDPLQAVAVANARRATGRDEPWRTILSPEDHLALVAGTGWGVDEVDEVGQRRGTLLVSAHPPLGS